MTTTQPPYQDTVYALARAGATCYAARASGLYRSDDGGATWALATGSLALDGPLATTAVAAQGQEVFAGVKGAILRSSNDGADWFTAVLPPPAPLVSALALSPNYAEDGVLVAGTAEDGVFVSTDRGGQWQPWNFGLLDLAVFSVAFSPMFAVDQTVLIGTESGVFRSRNGGRAWRALPFPMEAAPVLSLGFAPGPAGECHLLAGTEAHGLYCADPDGQGWQRVAPDQITGAVNAIVTPPLAPDARWLLLDDRLLVSSDGGRRWTDHPTQLPPDAQALAVLPGSEPDQPTLVGCADGTILRVP